MQVPFGMSKRKIESMFTTLDCLDMMANDAACDRDAVMNMPLDDDVKRDGHDIDAEVKCRAAEKVMSILDADREALNAKDLEDMCKLEK